MGYVLYYCFAQWWSGVLSSCEDLTLPGQKTVCNKTLCKSMCCCAKLTGCCSSLIFTVRLEVRYWSSHNFQQESLETYSPRCQTIPLNQHYFRNSSRHKKLPLHKLIICHDLNVKKRSRKEASLISWRCVKTCWTEPHMQSSVINAWKAINVPGSRPPAVAADIWFTHVTLSWQRT